jgi:hypothetical protein
MREDHSGRCKKPIEREFVARRIGSPTATTDPSRTE